MSKRFVIRKGNNKAKMTVSSLRPLYTYADPKEKERMTRSKNRNKRRNKK